MLEDELLEDQNFGLNDDEENEWWKETLEDGLPDDDKK